MIGQIAPNMWIVENGDPTGTAIDILDAPKGALIIDTSAPTIYVKTTGYGDNSGFEQVQAANGLNLPLSDPHVNGALYRSGDYVVISNG